MGDERTGLPWPWTEPDRVHIIEQYASDSRVVCPIDESPLNVVAKRGIVRIRCLLCGNAIVHDPTKAQ